ncbi:NYN domain-containing protein [Nocardioides dongkuii]|uniref:NYN domain-containing protein n=1 Tax=Nocardioides dongkuii TaxID=2760089 RepID=UPI0015FDE935|nr:NYN domain-containing protein [Nocardioides dongkuii]
MPPTHARLAVLIDADNTSPRHATALLEEVAKYGVPTVKRAYGDWTTQNLVGWKVELNRNAIHPIQQFAYTARKNSTDSALIIDAMDLLYTGDLDAFAIVSSDSDFTRLVTRLRESGKTVYGFGRRRTPESLVAACDKFIYLEILDQDAEPDERVGVDAADDADPDEPDESTPLPNLQSILAKAINATSQDDGWARLDAVGSWLSTRHASFDPRNYGASKLVDLVRGERFVEVDQPDSGQLRVRLKGGRRTTTASATPPEASTTPAKTPAKDAPKTATKTAAKRTTKRTTKRTPAPDQSS